jgi:hypothetical protein
MKKLLLSSLLSMLYVNSMYASTPMGLSQDKTIKITSQTSGTVHFWAWGYNSQDNPETIAIDASYKTKNSITIPKGFHVVNFGAKFYFGNPKQNHPLDTNQAQGTQMDFQVESIANINNIKEIIISGTFLKPYNADKDRYMKIIENDREYFLKPDIAKISPNNPGDMNNRLFVVTQM